MKEKYFTSKYNKKSKRFLKGNIFKIANTIHNNMALFKKEVPKPTSTPTDKVLELRQQGMSDNQIVQQMQRDNHSSEDIFNALSQADLKNQNMPGNLPPPMAETVPPTRAWKLSFMAVCIFFSPLVMFPRADDAKPLMKPLPKFPPCALPRIPLTTPWEMALISASLANAVPIPCASPAESPPKIAPLTPISKT